MIKGIGVFYLLAIAAIVNAQTINLSVVNETPNSRYNAHLNETVTDLNTRLMWKKCPEGLSGDGCLVGSVSIYNGQQALQLMGTSFAGHDDWRLPNLEELRSLIAYDRYNPAINSDVFPETGVSWYWSSSSYGSTSSKVVDFYEGFTNSHFHDELLKVRLVRDVE
jgi:hypothetical protein